MTRWHALTPTDDSFLQSAAVRVRKVLDVPVPTTVLWAALSADDAVVSWSPGVSKVRWIGDRPYGVGTIREVTLRGAGTLREKFYRWEEGSRMTFSVAESSSPGIRSFAEDYAVEATRDGSRLTWIVALEPAKLAQPSALVLGPVLNVAVGSMVRGLRAKLQREAG